MNDDQKMRQKIDSWPKMSGELWSDFGFWILVADLVSAQDYLLLCTPGRWGLSLGCGGGGWYCGFCEFVALKSANIFGISALGYDIHFRRRLLIRSMRNEARMRNLGSFSKLAIAKARCDRLCSQASLILKDKFSDYLLTPRLFSIISQKIHIITSVFGTDNSHTRCGTPKNMFTDSGAVHIFSLHFLIAFRVNIYASRSMSDDTRRCTFYPMNSRNPCRHFYFVPDNLFVLSMPLPFM